VNVKEYSATLRLAYVYMLTPAKLSHATLMSIKHQIKNNIMRSPKKVVARLETKFTCAVRAKAGHQYCEEK